MNKICHKCKKTFSRLEGRSASQWSEQKYCSMDCVSKARITHGISRSRFAYIWSHMKSRCLNKNNLFYKNYGGRGIKVCNKWLAFEGFAADMLPSYRENLTLDRIDVYGVKSFISSLIATRERAFGGCKECYGKGYSTQHHGIHGAEDFGGEGHDIETSVHMNFCSCDRGEQLKELIQDKKQK